MVSALTIDNGCLVFVVEDSRWLKAVAILIANEPLESLSFVSCDWSGYTERKPTVTPAKHRLASLSVNSVTALEQEKNSASQDLFEKHYMGLFDVPKLDEATVSEKSATR